MKSIHPTSSPRVLLLLRERADMLRILDAPAGIEGPRVLGDDFIAIENAYNIARSENDDCPSD